ncbi:MAG: hypothetical protein Q8R60_11085 [Mycobacteriales bacterium]|nr:hypothetical protein [Mycobacteriales bacterium]
MMVALLSGVVALALALELLARGLAKVVDEPLWWHDLVTQRKEAQLRRLARNGPIDVIVIGTSMTLYGVDPDPLVRATGLRCYNASIYRGVPSVSARWMTDVVLPVARPRLVLIEVAPLIVNDNSPLTSRLEEYLAAPAHRLSRGQRLRRRCEDRSYAVRHAGLVRRPRAFARALRELARRPGLLGWRVPLEVEGRLGPLGQGTDLLERSYRNGPKMRELIRQQAQTDFNDGGVQSGALREMARSSRARGAQVVYLMLPVPTEMLDEMFVGGRTNWIAMKEDLRRLAAEEQVPLMDVTDDFEDSSYYADMVHLNGRGRDAFSQRVAAALVQHLAGALPGANDARRQADSHAV